MYRLGRRAQGTTGTAAGVRHEHAPVANRGARGGAVRGVPRLGGADEVMARTVRCTPREAAAQAV
ncbi:hypothetical protein [Streptomyces sp. KMM 9044]|uniref:hypothetical protein n=1 Tax=Streptomyces sp. KMM 9044 TaxID=2744474 RepID=UPI002151E8A4|nr:hypothetical protein [Streptomyces sp. KMM 9044]WAX81371.1 hypothetical protein HUV60_030705 [Streptomyces sp. KMM 9044]